MVKAVSLSKLRSHASVEAFGLLSALSVLDRGHATELGKEGDVAQNHLIILPTSLFQLLSELPMPTPEMMGNPLWKSPACILF